MTLLYLFLAILVIKLAINLAKYFQCKHYLAKYNGWLKNRTWDLVEDKSQVIKLLREAGIQDSYLPYIEPIGYGKLLSANVSVFDNFPKNREDFINLMAEKFYEAIGVYRSRALETFSPLFWIEFILTLPKQALSYLGVSPESVAVKVAQIIYWVLCVVIGFVFTIYRPEVESLIRNWVAKLTP